MTSVQEGVSALAVAQRWSEWSQLHDGDRDDLRTVESLTISLKQNKTQELVEIWKVGIRLRRACSIICIYNHSTSSRDPFAKKNNDKDHGRTNNANGKAPEELNMEGHNNFDHIWVQPKAHMSEKGTHFSAMGATSRRWYRSQM
ncbi:hypothetical protein V6N13_059228 [Hibiscus sabdariffa]